MQKNSVFLPVRLGTYSDRPRPSVSLLQHFPAFLSLDNKPCLLVGGGDVASRKARLLLAAGASLTVVAPDVSPSMTRMLAEHSGLRWIARKFTEADLDGCWLVVSATGDPAIESRVAAAAGRRRIFCNAVDDKDNCSFITPAIVDRSPVVVAISTGGSAPVLARRLREVIEKLLPPALGRLAELARELRDEVKANLDDFAARLRFWERFFDGSVAQDAYAGDLRNARARAMQLLADADISPQGEAWLVGAGPGDPGMLTLAALQAMQRADVILHDRLVSGEILSLARRDATLVSVGKTPGCAANSQQEINALLVGLVADGKRVVRLKGGDPFIFGRGGEEAEALDAAGLRWRAVPGITAAAGCAAVAGIPLTHRDDAQSVVLLTAHGKHSVDTLDWASLARERQTLAVYMGVRRFPTLMQKLIAHGRGADTPVAIIERGSTPEQRVVRGTLGQLVLLAAANRIEAPAMLIIGDVARRGHAAPERAGAAAAPAAPTSFAESAIQTG